MRVFGLSESPDRTQSEAHRQSRGAGRLGVLQRPQQALRHGPPHGPQRCAHTRSSARAAGSRAAAWSAATPAASPQGQRYGIVGRHGLIRKRHCAVFRSAGSAYRGHHAGSAQQHPHPPNVDPFLGGSLRLPGFGDAAPICGRRSPEGLAVANHSSSASNASGPAALLPQGTDRRHTAVVGGLVIALEDCVPPGANGPRSR